METINSDTHPAEAAVLDGIAERLNEESRVIDTQVYYARGDVEVDVQLPNPTWGLPASVHDALRGCDGHIDDFSHVDQEYVRLYIKPD
jgi:hypothetical protein